MVFRTRILVAIIVLGFGHLYGQQTPQTIDLTSNTNTFSQELCATSSTINISTYTNSASDSAYQWESRVGTGLWSNYNGADAQLASISVSAPTTSSNEGYRRIRYYYVSGTSGPTTSDTITVTIKPLVTISGDSEICPNEEVILTSNYSGTWTTTNSSKVQIVNQTGKIKGISAGSATIKIENSDGCYAEKQITVAAAPTIDAGMSNSVCIGSQVTLTASGAATYSWTSSTGQTVSQGVAFTPTATATYTVTGTNLAGCTGTDTRTITLNPIPTVTPSLSETIICSGETVTLSASGADSYNWTDANGDPIVGSTFTPSTSGTQTLTVVGTANNCSGTSTIDLTVNPLPIITGPSTVRPNENITLTTTSTAAITAAWTDNPSGVVSISAAGSTLTVTGTSAGLNQDATIEFTDDKGCSSSTLISVESQPDIQGTTEICAGSSTTLNFGTASHAGTWSITPSNGSVATIDATSGALTGSNVTTSTLATVKFTATSGWVSTKQITVFPKPVLTATSSIAPNSGGQVEVCSGGKLDLTATSDVTLNGVGFVWKDPAGNSLTSVTDLVPTLYGAYTLDGTSADGCTADQVSIDITQGVSVAVTGDATICPNEEVTLTSNYTGTWSSSSPAVSIINPNGTIKGITPNGSATIKLTTSQGCEGSMLVTVTGAPNVEAGASSSVCTGTQVTLNATSTTSGYSYSWTSTSGQAISQGVPFVPSQTATYTVTASDGSTGCSATDLVTVTVNSKPSVTPTLSTQNICLGESINLTASGADTYVWEDGNGDPINTSSYSPTAAGQEILTVVGTSNGCSTTATTTISIGSIPSITGPSVLYAGQDIELVSASDPKTPASNAWTVSPSTTIVDHQLKSSQPTTGSIYVLTGLSSGVGSSVSVVYENEDGCQSLAKVVSVQAAPSISGQSSICVGGSTVLSISGASTGTWTIADNSVASIAQSGTEVTVTGADVSTPTITTLTFQAGNGWVSDPYQVTVYPKPILVASTNLTPNSDGEYDVCSGGKIDLIASSDIALDGNGFVWKDPNGGIITQATDYSPTLSGTYTLNATSLNGCAAEQASIEINVGDPILITGKNLLCPDEETVLSANYSGTWTSSNASVQIVDQTGKIKGITPNGQAIIKLENSQGCYAEKQVDVSIIPNVTVDDDFSVCSGTEVTLNASGVTGGTYQWTSSSGQAITQGVPFVPSQTSTYTVTATNTSNCSAVNSLIITVNQKPTVTITLSNTQVCVGSPVTFDASGANTYTWYDDYASSGSFSLISSTSSPYTYTPTSAGSKVITVVAEDANCASIATTTLNVNPKPQITGPVSVVVGETVTNSVLQAPSNVTPWTVTPNTGIVTYSISSDEKSIHLTGVNAGSSVSIQFKNLQGCKSESKSILVTSEPQITGPSKVCAGSDISLGFSSSQTGTWSSADDQVATVDANGVVTGQSVLSATTVLISFSSQDGWTSSRQIEVLPLPVLTLTAGEPLVNGQVETCPGAAINLTASSNLSMKTTGFIWIDPSGSTISGENSKDLNILLPVSGSYRVKGESLNGCFSPSTSIAVNVGSAVTISGKTTICPDEEVLLTSNYSGTWRTSNVDNVEIVNQNGKIRGLKPNSQASIVLETDDGCESSPKLITVSPLPVANAGSDFDGCEGTTITLEAENTAANTLYEWESSIGQLNITNNTPFIPSGTANYTLTATNAIGCSATDVVSVTINTKPSVVSAITNTQICLGNSVTLSASGADTYIWEDENGVTINTVNYIPTDPGSQKIYVVGTQGDCESSPVEVELNVLDKPVVTGNSYVYVNGTTQLTTLSTPKTSPAWSVDPQFLIVSYQESSDRKFFDITGLSSGQGSSVTVVFEDDNGCTSAPKNVEVRAVPVIQGESNICTEESTQLDFGSNIYTGQWSSDDVSIATVSPNGVVEGVSTSTTLETVEIKFTADEGWSSTKAINVRPKPTLSFTSVPVAQVSGKIEYCEGSEIQISGNGITSGIYSWTNSDGSAQTELVNGIKFEPTLSSGSNSKTYTLSASDEHGCSNNLDVTVKKLAKPTITSLTGFEVCSGESITLGGNGATGATPWFWSSLAFSDQSVTSTSVELEAINESSSDLISTISYTNDNNCTASQEITIKPKPDLIAYASVPVNDDGKVVICDGGELDLIAGPSSLTGFTWRDPNGSIISNTTNYTPNVVGTYTVLGTDLSGCETELGEIDIDIVSSTDLLITTTPAMDANDVVTICLGDEVDISIDNQQDFNQISWSPVILNTNKIKPTSPGPVLYTVTANTTVGSCESVKSFTVNTLPAPAFTSSLATTVNTFTTLTVGSGNISSSSTSFSWSIGKAGVAITPSTTTYSSAGFTPSAVGNYTVTYTDNSGCPVTGTLVVTTGPEITAPDNKFTFCEGENLELSASVPGGSWSVNPSDVGKISVSANGVVTNNSSTLFSSGTKTATILYTVSGVDYTKAITVYESPTFGLVFDLGSDEICYNDQIQLTPTPSNIQNLVWNTSTNENGVYTPQTGVSFVPGNSSGEPIVKTYSFQAEDQFGCSAEFSKAVTINPEPSVISTSGGFDLCESSNDEIILQATSDFSPAISNSWTSGSNVSITTPNYSSTTTVTPNSGGVEQIIFTDDQGCSTTIDITVHQAGSIAITGELSVCEGTSPNLSVSPSNGWENIYWKNEDTDVSIGLGNTIDNYQLTETTDITVVGTDANGCDVEATEKITVKGKPQLTSSSGVFEVCSGGSITISASTSGNDWSVDPAAIHSISSSGVLSVSGNVPAIVTFEDQDGCTTEQIVEVLANPVVSLGDDVVICDGNSVELLAQEISSNDGAAYYTWDNGITETGGTVNVNPSESTSYNVFLTDNKGCVSEPDAILVAVQPSPTIVGPSNVSQGSVTQYTSEPVISGSPWSLALTSLATVDAATGELTANAATNGVPVTLKLSNTSSCIVEKDIEIVALPVLSQGTIFETCIGLERQLTVDDEVSNPPHLTEPWRSDDPTVVSINSDGVLIGHKSGSTDVIYKDLYGGEAIVEVIVYNAPSLSTTSGKTVVCLNEEITINSDREIDPDKWEYTRFSPVNSILYSSYSESFKSPTSGNGLITITDEFGCRVSLGIEIKPSPQAPVLSFTDYTGEVIEECIGDGIEMTINSPTASKYEWIRVYPDPTPGTPNFTGRPVWTTTTENTYLAKFEGVYGVRAISANQCVSSISSNYLNIKDSRNKYDLGPMSTLLKVSNLAPIQSASYKAICSDQSATISIDYDAFSTFQTAKDEGYQPIWYHSAVEYGTYAQVGNIGDEQITNVQSGYYYVVLQDPSGDCISDVPSDRIRVEIIEVSEPEPTISKYTACFGETGIDLSVPGYNSSYVYKWNIDQVYPTSNAAAEDKFDIFRTPNGNDGSKGTGTTTNPNDNRHHNRPYKNPLREDILTYGAGFFAGGVLGHDEYESFEISITATDEHGCAVSATIPSTLKVYGKPELPIIEAVDGVTLNGSEVCASDIIELQVQNEAADLTYTWYEAGVPYLSTPVQATHSVPFTVVAESAEGCSATSLDPFMLLEKSVQKPVIEFRTTDGAVATGDPYLMCGLIDDAGNSESIIVHVEKNITISDDGESVIYELYVNDATGTYVMIDQTTIVNDYSQDGFDLFTISASDAPVTTKSYKVRGYQAGGCSSDFSDEIRLLKVTPALPAVTAQGSFACEDLGMVYPTNLQSDDYFEVNGSSTWLTSEWYYEKEDGTQIKLNINNYDEPYSIWPYTTSNPRRRIARQRADINLIPVGDRFWNSSNTPSFWDSRTDFALTFIYEVDATGRGCTKSASASINIKPNPKDGPTISDLSGLGYDVDLCSNEQVIYEVESQNSDYTYNWFRNSTLGYTDAISVGGQYTIQETDLQQDVEYEFGVYAVSQDGCRSPQSNITNVRSLALKSPSVYWNSTNTGSSQSICDEEGAFAGIKVTPSKSNLVYQVVKYNNVTLEYEDYTEIESQIGTGGQIEFDLDEPGRYAVVAKKFSGGTLLCQSPPSSDMYVELTEFPYDDDQSITSPTNFIGCEDYAFELRLKHNPGSAWSIDWFNEVPPSDPTSSSPPVIQPGNLVSNPNEQYILRRTSPGATGAKWYARVTSINTGCSKVYESAPIDVKPRAPKVATDRTSILLYTYNRAGDSGPQEVTINQTGKFQWYKNGKTDNDKHYGAEFKSVWQFYHEWDGYWYNRSWGDGTYYVVEQTSPTDPIYAGCPSEFSDPIEVKYAKIQDFTTDLGSGTPGAPSTSDPDSYLIDICPSNTMSIEVLNPELDVTYTLLRSFSESYWDENHTDVDAITSFTAGTSPTNILQFSQASSGTQYYKVRANRYGYPEKLADEVYKVTVQDIGISNPIPVIELRNATAGIPVCEGTNVYLEATNTHGGAVYWYKESDGQVLNEGEPSRYFYPTESATYGAYNVLNGCPVYANSTNSKEVVYIEAPEAPEVDKLNTKIYRLCSTDNNVIDIPVGTRKALESYSWFNVDTDPNLTPSFSELNYNYSVTGPGKYYVKAKNAQGCIGESSDTIVYTEDSYNIPLITSYLEPFPSFVLNDGDKICPDQTIAIDVSGTNLQEGVTYQLEVSTATGSWTPMAGKSFTFDAILTQPEDLIFENLPVGNFGYRVLADIPGGTCDAVPSHPDDSEGFVINEHNVLPKPTLPPVFLATTTVFCEGDPGYPLTVNNDNILDDDIRYEWYDVLNGVYFPNSSEPSNIKNAKLIVDALPEGEAHIKVIKVFQETGCRIESDDVAKFIENPKPEVPTLAYEGDELFPNHLFKPCLNEEITINVTSSGGVTYSWYKLSDQTFLGTGISRSFKNLKGWYGVVAKSTECTSDTARFNLGLSDSESPDIAFVGSLQGFCPGDSLELYLESTDEDKYSKLYQWQYKPVGSTSSSWVPIEQTNYSKHIYAKEEGLYSVQAITQAEDSFENLKTCFSPRTNSPLQLMKLGVPSAPVVTEPYICRPEQDQYALESLTDFGAYPDGTIAVRFYQQITDVQILENTSDPNSDGVLTVDDFYRDALSQETINVIYENGETGCISDTTKLTIHSIDIPAPPAVLAYDYVCASSGAVYDLENLVLTPNWKDDYNLYMYDEDGNEVIDNFITISLSSTNTETYYFEFETTAGAQCRSGQNSSVLRINDIPSSPTTSNSEICLGQEFDIDDLVTPVSNISFKYYKRASALSSDALTATEADNIIIESDTAFWVTAIDNEGCESEPEKIQVDLKELEGVGFTSSQTYVPYGGQVTLSATVNGVVPNATEGYSYKFWYVDHGTTITSGNLTPMGSQNPFVSQVNDPGGKYIVKVSDITSCSKYDTVDVYVNAFLPGSLTGEQIICAGELPQPVYNDQFPTGGSGDYTFEWEIISPSNDKLTLQIDKPNFIFEEGLLPSTFYEPGARDLTVRRIAIDSEKRAITNEINIEVLSVPFTAISAFDKTTNLPKLKIPTGEPINVAISHGTLSYLVDYKWFIDGTESGYNTATIQDLILSEGVHNIESRVFRINSITNEAKCYRSQNINIEVNDINSGAVADDQTVCLGDKPFDLTEQIAPSGGSGSFLYSWELSLDGGATWQTAIDPTTGLPNSDPNFIFTNLNTPSASTKYRRIIKDYGQRAVTPAVNVSIIDNSYWEPVFQAPSSCQGQYIGELSATPGQRIPGSAPSDPPSEWISPDFEIVWFGSNNISSRLSTPPIPDSNTTASQNFYVAQEHKGNGCISPIYNVSMRVNSLPQEPITFDTIVCPTDVDFFNPRAQLRPDGTGPDWQYQILWYKSDSITGISGTPLISGQTLDEDQTYVVRQQHINTGCISTPVELHVDLYDFPVLDIYSTDDEFSLCKGDSLTIALGGLKDDLEHAHWYEIEYLPTGTSTLVPLDTGYVTKIQPEKTTMYMVAVKTFGRCVDTLYQSVSVVNRPAKPNAVEYDYCQNAPSVPISTPGLNVGNFLIQYYADGNTDTITQLVAPATDSIGDFFYFTTQYDPITGCQSDIDTAVVRINPNPGQPVSEVQYICVGSLGELSVNIGPVLNPLDNDVEWYTSDYQGIESTPIVSTSDTGTYVYYAQNINTETSCRSPLSKITANVYKIQNGTITKTPPTCYDFLDGTIRVAADGPVATKWNYTKDDTIVSALYASGQELMVGSGEYKITITDIKGCSTVEYIDENFFTLENPNPIQIEEVITTRPTCFDTSDASITIIASGREDLRFSIDGGVSYSDTNVFLNLSPYQSTFSQGTGRVIRTYTLNVTDSIGCPMYQRPDQSVDSNYYSIALPGAFAGTQDWDTSGVGAFAGASVYSQSGRQWQTINNNFEIEDSTTWLTFYVPFNDVAANDVEYFKKSPGSTTIDLRRFVSIRLVSNTGVAFMRTIENRKGVVVNGNTSSMQAIPSNIIGGSKKIEVNMFNQNQLDPGIYELQISSYFSAFLNSASSNDSIRIHTNTQATASIQPKHLSQVFFKGVQRKITLPETKKTEYYGTTVLSPLSCWDSEDGHIFIQATGTNELSFNIDSTFQSFSSNRELNNLDSGNYYVTIRDQNDCYVYYNGNREVVIRSPNQVIVDSVYTKPISCYGFGDAEVEIFGRGGIIKNNPDASYTPSLVEYNLYRTDIGDQNIWTTNNKFSNLYPGWYQFKASVLSPTEDDATNRCAFATDRSTFIYVSEPSEVTLDSVHVIRGIQCYDSTDAVIQIWGNSDYKLTYSLDSINFQDSTHFYNLPPGKYWPTVKDENGCPWTNNYSLDSIMLIEPDPIYLNVNASNLLCYDDFSGILDLDVIGGNYDSTEIEYGWNYDYLFDTTSAINGQLGYYLTKHLSIEDSLWAGRYVVHATDYKGCEIFDTVTLSQPNPVVLDSVYSKAVSCYDSTDAVLEIYASGGNYLEYDLGALFTPTPNSTSVWNDLAPGDSVFITVIDSNLCAVDYGSVDRAVVFDSIAKFVIDSIVVTSPLCHGDTTGTIEILYSGGENPYFTLDSNSTFIIDTMFYEVPADSVYITVSDKNNCVPEYKVSRSYNIVEPDLLTITAFSDSIVNCYNDSTGIIRATITGGTQPYDVLWSNGTTSTYDSSATAGLYYVDVYDANNCYAWDSISVLTYDRDCDNIPDSVETFVDSDLDGLPNGYDLDSDNDAIPDSLEYDTNRDGIVGDDCDGDGIPDYLDADLCELYIPSVITPNGDGKNDQLEIPALRYFSNYKFSVFNVYGNKVYEVEDQGNGFNGSSLNTVVWYSGTGELPPGTYYYVLEIRPNKLRQAGYIYIAR